MSRFARTACVPRALANSAAWGKMAISLSDLAAKGGLIRSATLIVLSDRASSSIVRALDLFGVEIEPRERSDRRGFDDAIAGWISDRDLVSLLLRRGDVGRLRKVSGVAVISICRGVVHVTSLTDLIRAFDLLSPQIFSSRSLIDRARARESQGKSRGEKSQGTKRIRGPS